MAHIGALKVFERHGIRFDLIVGASMGALVGAAYAAGMAPGEIERLAMTTPLREVFRPDFTGNQAGFLDASVVSAYLQQVFGDRHVEELAVPFVAATASLRRREIVGLNRGPLAEVIQAAIAIPLFWPPVPTDDDYLLDAGLVDGLPIGLARTLGAERVVAVNANGPSLRVLDRWPATLLREHVMRLTDRLLQTEPPAPTRRWVFLHQVHAATRTDLGLERADLTIWPPFGAIYANDYRQRARCIAMGEEAAQARIEDLRRLVE
jgi:NTE family protein